MYLLVVAFRMAASWPLHRNLSNSSFLRVLFSKRALRPFVVALAVDVIVSLMFDADSGCCVRME